MAEVRVDESNSKDKIDLVEFNKMKSDLEHFKRLVINLLNENQTARIDSVIESEMQRSQVDFRIDKETNTDFPARISGHFERMRVWKSMGNIRMETLV